MLGSINTEGGSDYSFNVSAVVGYHNKFSSNFLGNSHLCGLHHSNQEKSQLQKNVFIYTRLARQSMIACFAFFFYYYLFAIFPHLFVFPSLWEMATVTSTGVDEECSPVFNAGLKEALIDPCRQGWAGEVARHRQRTSSPACRRRGCQADADRSFPIHAGEGEGTGAELQIQQPRIQMTMTGIDAPSWFFHKAIPPHQLLGGRVGLSQQNRDKNVSCRLLT